MSVVGVWMSLCRLCPPSECHQNGTEQLGAQLGGWNPLVGPAVSPCGGDFTGTKDGTLHTGHCCPQNPLESGRAALGPALWSWVLLGLRVLCNKNTEGTELSLPLSQCQGQTAALSVGMCSVHFCLSSHGRNVGSA